MDWQQYEQHMLSHAKSYTVTEFLGRAKYKVLPFDTLQEATQTYRAMRDETPPRKVIVYAVCHPPTRELTVSLPIAEADLP